ncbi:MAG: TonB-dependent receptor [bacterium]|nr:TonB-dependent receptor [bacterium]
MRRGRIWQASGSAAAVLLWAATVATVAGAQTVGALADSVQLAGPAGVASAALVETAGGARDPWVPFAGDVMDLLGRSTPLVAVRDGLPGSPLLLLHLPGDDGIPGAELDGLPLGLGHRWADDPWTWSLAGVDLARADFAQDPRGGGAPRLAWTSSPADTAGSLLDSAFFKGGGDTYLRRLSLRTQQAPWEGRFDFEELLDELPEDGSAGSGSPESRSRLARTTLIRRLPGAATLTVGYARDRRHKTGLPRYGAQRQETWGDRTSATWRQPWGTGELSAGLWSSRVDVVREIGTADRKVETGRDGARLELGRDAWRLGAQVASWRLDDDAAGTPGWAGADTARVAVTGRDAVGDLSWTSPAAAGLASGWRLEGAARWHEFAGWSPHLGVAWKPAGRPVRFGLSRGGRAPRLDELFTSERVYAGSRAVVLLPARDLGWEQLTEATLAADGRLAGHALRFDATWRRLRDGIGWRAAAPGADVGRWANEVELEGWTATLALARAVRLAGWLRWEASASLRGVEVGAGMPLALPPRRSAVLNVFWEHHAFREDGILELGYVLELRGAMADPWIPGAPRDVPALTLHHLLASFRLVGADLGLELRNLTDDTTAVVPLVAAPGREMRWRLQWTLRR